MATLQELMAEVGLGETNQGQEKTASAAKISSTSEVDQMLENLGLQGSETVKTASAATEKKNGGNMSLSDIYEQIMGGNAPEAGQEKTASETGEAGTQTAEGDEQSTAFGELVAEYFTEVAEPYYEKVAADLESEAGKGEQPLAHAHTGGSMTAALGKPADPHLAVNHSASSGAALHVAVQNSTPYALREAALKKTILKRMAAAPVGDIKD